MLISWYLTFRNSSVCVYLKTRCWSWCIVWLEHRWRKKQRSWQDLKSRCSAIIDVIWSLWKVWQQVVISALVLLVLLWFSWQNRKWWFFDKWRGLVIELNRSVPLVAVLKVVRSQFRVLIIECCVESCVLITEASVRYNWACRSYIILAFCDVFVFVYLPLML